MHLWKVVPISSGQLLDVRKEDLLEGNLYRKCSCYQGGGGYDKFPEIHKRRFGEEKSQQFVVQLYGCNLEEGGRRWSRETAPFPNRKEGNGPRQVW